MDRFIVVSKKTVKDAGTKKKKKVKGAGTKKKVKGAVTNKKVKRVVTKDDSPATVSMTLPSCDEVSIMLNRYPVTEREQNDLQLSVNRRTGKNKI